MRTLNRLGLVLGLGIALAAVACGSDDDDTDDNNGGTGGATGGTGGATGGSGGATGGTGGATGGSAGSTGGSAGSTGGSAGSTGGSAGSTGGSAGSTGGSAGSTGGSAGSTGGSAGSTGGTAGAGGGGGACNATIADLRSSATGASDLAVDLEVCDVVVTYVSGSGYFIQENDSTGPAIQVYEGNSWTPDVEVGDVINVRVTEVSEYNGLQEVTAHETVAVQSQGFDVSTITQDLTVAPSEDYESELVQITNASIVTLSGNDATIDYGTATGVVLRLSETAGLCEGATVDILAPVTEYSSEHRIQSFSAADFTNLDTSACAQGAGRTPEPGELVINEFLADPPPDDSGTTEVEGDANCDGSRSNDDEFIEIVNLTGDVLALDGVTISDSSSVRFTFPVATDLPANSVMLVFGGGTVSCTFPSNVQTMTASTSLSLNNTGDSITLARDDGAELATLTYTGTNDDDASQTLNPDLNDTDSSTTVIGGFVLHTTAGSTPYSPGTKIDGSDF